MKRKPITISHEPTEAEIQHAAYLLWIDRGRPEGRDFEHWLAAKELLCRRGGRAAQRTRKVDKVSAPELRRAGAN